MKVSLGENGKFPLAYFLSSDPYVSVHCVEVNENGSFTCDCSGFTIKGSCNHYHIALDKLMSGEWIIVPSDNLHDAYVEVMDAKR